MKNISKGTIIRLIVVILVIANIILKAFGKSPIDIEEGTIVYWLETAIEIAIIAVGFWKNNSFSEAAIKADEFLHNLKSGVIETEPPEQLGGTSTLTFADWVKKYLGKKTDYDGVYGVQCVDLIDCFIDTCLGLKKGFWGNAKDWWTNRNNTWLKNNFDIITPTYKNGELKAGDIGIRTSGTYGHIFIIAGPAANGDFKYYDQNATGKNEGMALRTKAFNSSNINGILRPKNQTPFKTATATSTPTFKKSDVITLTTNVNVRTGAGTNYAQKTVSQLTADGKKNATSTKASDKATLKSGTKATILALKTVGSDIWAQIPSGWICLRFNGKYYAK